ncbi:JAB domain-containing protein [Sphingobacterium hungaricum]|uniref:DNA repair protein n=1 Tax=Sphingobacterium hungaricum TaxID=2082723 RepID=A0A928UY23_9SPHI|nr:JAB domain-containing protein [Sphingobacterium hungaricum]MBE8712684.1 DNA repair protein [Sphingobacterium hungaricum]
MKTNFIAHELRISYHKDESLSVSDFKRVNCSALMDNVFRLIWNKDEINVRESFYAIFFNSKLDVVSYRKIVDGGLDAILVDIRLLMSTGLLCNAVRMAVAHNHPSGNLAPSRADKMLTQKIIDASAILGIDFLDHIVLTESTYYSFRDEGDIS